MDSKDLHKIISNVEASFNMEGINVSDECKALCEKLLKKELTFEEYLKQILKE